MTTPTELLQQSMPLCATMGMTAQEASAERVVLALAWDERWCTTAGLLHGGALMTLADSAGAMCAFFNLPEGSVGTSTIESKTNFLGAVTGGVVLATSTPLHAGSSTVVIETELRVEGRLVGKTTQTQHVRRARPS
jgi:uncharacterized protein (TIGR00369 family)